MSLEHLIVSFGYFGIAAMIFAESGLFFGFFLPGDSLLFAAGFMAAQGFLNLPIVIMLTIPAAIIGNSVGYLFGEGIGPLVFNKPDSFWFSEKRLKAAHEFFEKRGWLSIVFARFIPFIRTFVPIVAGAAKMDYKTFFLANVVGAVLWGISVPALGYYLGSLIPSIDRYLLPIIIVIMAISVAPLLAEYLSKRKKD